MKYLMIILFIANSILLSSCIGSKPVLVKPQAWSDRCKGVTTLSWQREIQSADAEAIVKIVTQATLAAKADAKSSDVYAEIDAEFRSELARVINENVSASSEVSTEFWEQEITFVRLYCLSISLLDREDLSKEQKENIVNDIREMQKAEATYLLNQKKSPIVTLDDTLDNKIYFTVQNYNKHELRIVKIYLEHLIDKARISATGYYPLMVPRRNLGTVYLKSDESEALLMSADNVLIVEPNSFVALKYTFNKIQNPREYMVGLNELEYSDVVDDEMIGALVKEQGEAIWDSYDLVVRYIDNEGVKVSKLRIGN